MADPQQPGDVAVETAPPPSSSSSSSSSS
ncbi:hypothetical protein VTH06DRAFT_2906, partial [Thermothelomyces fergusii]